MLFKASMRSVSSVYRKSEPLSGPLHLQVSHSHSRPPQACVAFSAADQVLLPPHSPPRGTLSLVFVPPSPAHWLHGDSSGTDWTSLKYVMGPRQPRECQRLGLLGSAHSQLPPPPFTLTGPSLTVLLPSPQSPYLLVVRFPLVPAPHRLKYSFLWAPTLFGNYPQALQLPLVVWLVQDLTLQREISILGGILMCLWVKGGSWWERRIRMHRKRNRKNHSVQEREAGRLQS